MENRAPSGHGEPAEAPSSSQMYLILVGIDCRDFGGPTGDLRRPFLPHQRFYRRRHGATTASAHLRVSLQTEPAPAQEPGQRVRKPMDTQGKAERQPGEPYT